MHYTLHFQQNIDLEHLYSSPSFDSTVFDKWTNDENNNKKTDWKNNERDTHRERECKQKAYEERHEFLKHHKFKI